MSLGGVIVTCIQNNLLKPELMTKKDIIKLICDTLETEGAKELWIDGKSGLFDLTRPKHVLIVIKEYSNNFNVSAIFHLFSDAVKYGGFTTKVNCCAYSDANKEIISTYKTDNPEAVLVWKDGNWVYDTADRIRTIGEETLPKPRLELSRDDIKQIICETLEAGDALEFWTDGKSNLFDLTQPKDILIITRDDKAFDETRIYPIFAVDGDEDFLTLIDSPVPGVTNEMNRYYYNIRNQNPVLVWKEGVWLYVD